MTALAGRLQIHLFDPSRDGRLIATQCSTKKQPLGSREAEGLLKIRVNAALACRCQTLAQALSDLRRRENIAAPRRPTPTSAVLIGSGTVLRADTLLLPLTEVEPLASEKVKTFSRENAPALRSQLTDVAFTELAVLVAKEDDVEAVAAAEANDAFVALPK